MYKAEISNLPPILYLIMPIILGIITGFIVKKFFANKISYSMVVSIVINIIYLEIISWKTASQNEVQLFMILFIWNGVLTFIVNRVYLYLAKKISL